MKNLPATLDGHALTERYETLRNSVVDSSGRGQTLVRGHALLIFKGMAAWMMCVSELAVSRPAATASRNGLRVPVGMEENVVDIVATMVLATASEVNT